MTPGSQFCIARRYCHPGDVECVLLQLLAPQSSLPQPETAVPDQVCAVSDCVVTSSACASR